MDYRKITLFTLFHHQIEYLNREVNFDTYYLYDSTRRICKKDIKIQKLTDILLSSIQNQIRNGKNEDISLTLTGGMDSRLILACLLKAGVKPNCFTYGNPQNIDVVYAKDLAKKFGLKYHNAVQRPPDKDWYYNWVVETIKRDNGNSHLHRAHRTAAIAEHCKLYNPKVLFTGHMGGEGLRGLTYNNYFASPFFELVNEGKKGPSEAAKTVLDEYFLKTENINFNELMDEVNQLSWMKHDKETNKFFFLFDLVAKIHHAQDIRLFKSYVPNVVPVYLQKEYLETLFSSPYNFMAKKKGILGRLQNPLVYCKIIEQIYPDLLDYPLANGYTPREYLKGLWYYVPKKLYYNFKHKAKYPPTFSYGKWYVDFVKEHSQNIDPDIWEIFDKERYMKALYENDHECDEGYWHKFSNPIFFDLQNKLLKN